MTGLQRFLVRTVVFLVVVALVTGALYPVIIGSFLNNPWLNGLILSVLALGIAYNVRRILRLAPETRWIEAYRANAPGIGTREPPRLITPIAAALGERQRAKRAPLSAVSLRYLLDSLANRLDESRDIARYMTGLMIFLGLLGTFWGLLEAISAIGNVISGLGIGADADLAVLFEQMIAGLRQPLSGMGTAFSASLFGLAGSLVLGFLDLQATQAQNAFYNDLEEWLASLARLSGPETTGPDFGATGASLPAYVSAMLQQTADNMDRLQQLMARGEDGRGELTSVIGLLGQRLAALDDRLQRDQNMVERLLAGQQEMLRHLAQRAEGAAMDPASREHLRNTDLQLGRVLDELSRGRTELSRELRNEIKLVARTIAIVAGEPQAVKD